MILTRYTLCLYSVEIPGMEGITDTIEALSIRVDVVAIFNSLLMEDRTWRLTDESILIAVEGSDEKVRTKSR